ncbi:type VI-A CRISPR-associated RNA-guided ribonuclease Cas13a [Butyrivibrio sp. YAB3001]|uniref:type VI-A CRISPR-associated RNA-guided ribonuclease Cas13a n=1 Tax=Butyrivibrio sp. YAB3001 TaxID=1520812 RepID=UPI0008F64983|nr:type VI-A CRISPR-associated RNA-guided ribonuclease Cas13a [Butyrivibrio sp. YAB3001]SFB66467.1 hypothetical protein SAMN02910398_00008 [Butyrivibrio sp. YAB3001]
MKISKVDHRKTAVKITDNKGAEGFIYQDPTRDSSTMEQIISNRARSSKVLFNIFGDTKKSKDLNKYTESLIIYVNKAIKSLKGDKRNNKYEEITESLKTERVLNALIQAGNEFTCSENNIEDALNKYLKKSFRVGNTKSALKKLLMAAYCGYKLSIEEKEEIQNYFVDKLVKEYNKDTVLKYTAKSLKHQNMVVQPDTDNHVFLPSRIAGATQNKMSEKEALTEFLKAYAVLDEEKRHNLRIILRKLVNLYFYESPDFIYPENNEWKEHDDRKNKTETFVSPVKVNEEKNGKTFVKIDVPATKDLIRLKNIECYRRSVAETAGNPITYFTDHNISKFWIHHIENEVEKIFALLKSNWKDYQFSVGYISEKVWKEIINYLSIKYIAIGKAVYNYALEDIKKNDGTLNFGVIDPSFYDGINSFEYEKIKAEETFQREVAVYVSFAVNHLSSATVKLSEAQSDMLVLNKNDIEKIAYGNTKRNILQFFGGQSKWKEFDFDRYINPVNYTDIDFLFDIKKMVYSLRNESFHFTTTDTESDWNKNLISAMFEYECRRISTVQKNKFFSNNLPLFYGENSLERVLHKLYDDYVDRMSQVPSFGNVFVRKKFPDYMKEIGIKHNLSSEDNLKLQGALYFLYKEIYYNAFISSEKAMKIFVDLVNKLDTNARDDKGRITHEAMAHKNFKDAISHYMTHDCSLADICQKIMTEYNQQNTGHRKKQTTYSSEKNPEIFRHYKMILFMLLQKAMTEYISSEEIFDFIMKPNSPKTDIKEEEFLPQYKSCAYDNLIKLIADNVELQKWYITARLLSPREVNQLIGSFRSYKQFVSDIERRAKETNNSLSKSGMTVDVENITKVLDLCTKLNGRFSNELTDYFDSKDDYAVYVSKFLDFGFKIDEKFPAALLGEFCNKEENGKKIGIYHNGTEPILNSNIIKSKLYGITDVVSRAVKPVSEKLIREYLQQEVKIKPYLENGVCKNKEEQAALRKYQELKNRIEFRDIVEYSEIINELMGQLINFSYLRERDLMYFQLGFHYLCLNNYGAKPEGYYSIVNDKRTIKGAILYQIVAMYTYGLPIYHYVDGTISDRRKNKKTVLDTLNSSETVGAKIKYFIYYSDELFNDSLILYNAGLELFENINEHENIVNLRKYIDHFKYYVSQDRSLLDIYSEVFDRYFTYDRKYKKNVMNLFSNIMLKHFIITDFEFSTGEKTIGEKNTAKKECAKVRIKRGGLSSDKFTYKFKDAKPIELSAKNTEFLDGVARILYYPENVVLTDLVRNSEVEDEKRIEKYDRNHNSSPTRKDKTYKQDVKKNYNKKTSKAFDSSKLDTKSVGNNLSDNPVLKQFLSESKKKR